MRTLWTEGSVDFHGTYYDYDEVSFHSGTEMAPLGPLQKPPPIWVVSNPRLVDDSHDERMVKIMRRACRRIIEYGDGWMTCCRAEHPDELTEQIGYLDEAAGELDRDFSDYEVSYQVTMNIGDSEEAARTAFDSYISQYYPELSQAMDLSNWGPVGEPEQIADWLREFADRGVTHFICRFGDLDQFTQVERFAQAGPPRLRNHDREVIEMPTPEEIRKDAELVIDVCMSVEEDDVVTIICDNDHRDEADALAAVARRSRRLAGDHGQRGAGQQGPRGHALPDGAAAQPPSRDDQLRRDHHRHQPRVGQPLRARAGGQGVMRQQRQDLLRRAGDGRVGPHGREDRRSPSSARGTRWPRSRARQSATSPRPPGPTFASRSRAGPPLEVTSIKKRGQMMGPLPLWAEVAFAAVEDRTEGTIVVDGVMLGIGLPGQVTEPITWTMEKGRATAIEGGDDAARLREVIEGVENADVAGEFAFGVSEVAPFGTPSEKGRVGTVHFALGDNHLAYPGGQNVSRLHLDGVILNASLQIVDDGTYIVKDGEWAL